MEKRSLMLLMLVSSIAMAVAASCSAPDPKEVKQETNSVEVEECKTPTLSGAAKPAAAASLDDENYNTEDGFALLAVETPGYNDSVKSIVNGSCAVAGCHVAGATSPDLTTFALLKEEMDASKTRMENAANPMPPGGQLAAAQLAIYAAWVAGGGLETDVNSAVTDPVTTTPTTTPTPNDPATPAAAASECLVRNESRTVLDEPDYEYLLKDIDAKACHAAGKIYDRNAKGCGTAALDLTWCNRVGIIEKFAAYETKAGPVLDKALGKGTSETEIGDGFLIDQCGSEPNGTPIVSFIRLVKPPEVPGLKVRMLLVDPKKSTETTTE